MSETISVRRRFADDCQLHERHAMYVNGIPVRRTGLRIQLLHEDWPVETAEMVAAVLLELAEAARAEPDPELLAAVMKVVDESIGGDPCIDTEELARNLLRAFNVEKKHGRWS